MDIRQLETFLWIARLGSVTEACKRLNVTQSTLSMRLRALESELRVPLFDRSHKRLTLTLKGRDLVKHAEKIVGAVHEARLYLADPTAESGRIRIGASELVGLTWGPALMNRVSERYPNVTFDLDVGVPGTLMGQLLAGQLDVLLSPVLGPPAAGLYSLRLGSVKFSWMASPELGLGSDANPSALGHVAVIAYESNQSLTYPAVQRLWAEYDLSVRRIHGCNSIAASVALVAEGIGVSLLPEAYCKPLLESGRLEIVFPAHSMNYEYYALCRSADEKGLPSAIAQAAQPVFAAHQASYPAARANRGKRARK